MCIATFAQKPHSNVSGDYTGKEILNELKEIRRNQELNRHERDSVRKSRLHSYVQRNVELEVVPQNEYGVMLKILNRVGGIIIFTIMEQQKIDMFLAQNAEKLPKDKVLVLKDALEKLDDSKAMFVQTVDFKDPTTILIISILLGFLGIDRFMLGEVGLGIAKLLTCGGCYIWWIIDMVNAQDLTRKYNYKKLQEALMMQGITIY